MGLVRLAQIAIAGLSWRGGLGLWLGLAALGSMVVAAVLVASSAANRPPGSGVAVTSLEVSPVIARSGEPITITATIQNLNSRPITALTVGAAITHGQSIDIATARGEAPQLFAFVPVGAHATFATQVRLTGYGWARVGVAAIGDNTLVPPIGRTVLVIDPVPMAIEGAMLLLSLFTIVALFTALIGGSVRFIRGSARVIRPEPRLLGFGAALVVAAYLVWLALPTYVRAGSPISAGALAMTGVVGFLAGWTALAAGVRLGNSKRLSAAVALALYPLFGLVWVVINSLMLGRLPSQILRPSLLWEVAFWPFEVAQVFGVSFSMTP